MALLIGFAFLAGMITVLSPCVLPVLPVVLSGTVTTGRYRPVGIIIGFVATFTAITLVLSALVRAVGLDPDVLRIVAAVTILLFAAVLVVPALKDRFMATASSLASRASARRLPVQGTVAAGRFPGLGPGLATGASLGLVWTPCVGPIMASVITLAVTQAVDFGAAIITFSYAAGTAIPLMAVMLGGRSLIKRFPAFTAKLPAIQRVFGVLMIITGVAILTGWDRRFQTAVLRAFPQYGSGLTGIEDNPQVRQALESRQPSATGAAAEPDLSGADVLTRTRGEWFNSPPLTLAGLKGKVVLIDFWTYSCINCQRTIPYLAAWNRAYAADGLVIVGVHSPEFAFERDPSNLKQAMADLGVTWPVVQDNDFGIWNAFKNRYWPTKYLFDRTGRLVSSHAGEGAYEDTERMIQALLGRSSGPTTSAEVSAAVVTQGRTPELYLGKERAGEHQVPQTMDGTGQLRMERQPKANEWGLTGSWRQEGEYAESTGEGSITLHFMAKDVFAVITPVSAESGEISVEVNGGKLETQDVRSGTLKVDSDRLYHLVGLKDSTEGTLVLRPKGPVRIYTFTFS